jgi:hypothetical protein
MTTASDNYRDRGADSSEGAWRKLVWRCVDCVGKEPRPRAVWVLNAFDDGPDPLLDACITVGCLLPKSGQ